MGTVTNFLLCSFVVVIAQGRVNLEPDRPFVRVALHEEAVLECCYTTTTTTTEEAVVITWHRRVRNRTMGEQAVLLSYPLTKKEASGNKTCDKLKLKEVTLNDSGLYQCCLNSFGTKVLSHGTYLQVYKPLEKTINLNESTKNKILTAEGILLLLCVLVPSATLLCQSKKLHRLEKKKVMKEEENIYQGLNLDDCCATYDQIERSQGHGPYQDVCNIMEEEEEIQLEKP